MNNKEKLTMGLIIGFALVIFIPIMFIALRDQQAKSDWCVEHGMVDTGGGHAPIYCYDPKTRLVYKPE